jgi:hypothetical protein
MRPLINVIKTQRTVKDLDLSENKCDSLTAKALFDLVVDPQCPLKSLRLSGADLDDEEVAMFMHAFEENYSITELDLSHNLLGAKGGETRVAPGKWE